MIVFDLECRTGGHRFEGWFASSEAFGTQQQRGLVNCPQCQSADIIKAPMAPRLTRKTNQIVLPAPAAATSAPDARGVASVPKAPAISPAPVSLPPPVAAMMQAAVRIQAEALKTSRWVGDEFAQDARAMHYGEKDQAPIHGQATLQQAQDLVEEGIDVAPILFPLARPGQVN